MGSPWTGGKDSPNQTLRFEPIVDAPPQNQRYVSCHTGRAHSDYKVFRVSHEIALGFWVGHGLVEKTVQIPIVLFEPTGYPQTRRCFCWRHGQEHRTITKCLWENSAGISGNPWSRGKDRLESDHTFWTDGFCLRQGSGA